MTINIVSTGSFVTDEILDNQMLSEMVDTDDRWIVERTGIRERRIAGEMTTEQLAFEACKKAMEDSGVKADEIALVIFATITPDTTVPSSAFTVAGRLGIENAVCFDLNAACSGFIYSMSVASSLLESMKDGYALVIGSERLTKFVDWTDRSTCILFGDGAGCAIMKNKAGEKFKYRNSSLEIVDSILGGVYDYRKNLSLNSKENADDVTSGYIEMNGRQIYKFATETGPGIIEALLEKNSVDRDDIFLVIPHQANRRIIETMSSKCGIGIEKFFMNLDRYGNTSSASVAIAMDEALENTDIDRNKGKYIISLAFGGGLSYGGILLKCC